MKGRRPPKTGDARFTELLLAVALTGLIAGCSPNRIQPSDVPEISSVTPTSGLTVGITPVTIVGRRFQTGATVTMGGIAATVTGATDTTISVIAPSHGIGVVDVVVRNPDGATVTRPKAFSFVFGVPPIITAISPAIGSMDGGTPYKVTGSGLTSSVLTFGGVSVVEVRTEAGFLGYRATPAHAAGVVDVVATTPDGQSFRLAGAFTYVPANTLDFNGDWSGYGNNGQDDSIDFSIRDGVLLTVSCGATIVTFPSPPPVVNAAVSATSNGVVILAVRIVSASDAIGTVRLGSCSSSTMSVTRK